MNTSLQKLIICTLILTSIKPAIAESIKFVGEPQEVSDSTVSIQIAAFDANNQPITGGTFETTSGPGINVTAPNGQGIATLTGDSTQIALDELIQGNGLLAIDICFSNPPAETSCCVLYIDPFGLSLTLAENAKTTGDRANQADPEEETGGPNTSDNTGDPVSTATREFFFYKQLLDLRGPTLPVEFSLFHGSQLSDIAFFDHLPEDFAHNHHLSARVVDFNGNGTFFNLQFHLGLGRIITFERTPPETDWTLVNGERWKFTVEETATHFYLKDPGEQLLYIFKKHPLDTQVEPAFITHIFDRNGNNLTYTQPNDPTLQGPLSVTDNLGRTLTFTYEQPNELTADFREFLTQVIDHTGRQILFSYTEIDGEPRLTSITDTNGGLYQFTYDNDGFMTAKTLPAGNTPYTQTYDAIPDFFNEGLLGAVTTQTDAFGDTFTFTDGEAIPILGTRQVIITNPDGSQAKRFHSEANIATAIIDELGERQLFTPDDTNDRIVAAIDRDGGTLSYTFRDASGHLASTTNQLSDTTSYTYSEATAQTFTNPDNSETVQCVFIDLDRIDYADGSSIQFQRDANGNPTSTTNRANETSVFSYNSKGQVLTITNPTSGVTTFTYDGATALPATQTDSDTGITSFSYDTLSRLIQSIHPDTSQVTYSYDALDRIVTLIDEENVTTRFGYDPNSNIIQIINAEGTSEEQTLAFTYDALDRPASITDAEGDTSTFAYDYHEKPTSITFADGSVITSTYDKRRSLIESIDEEGNKTQYSRTASDLLEAITTALGRTTTFSRDPRGLLTKVTDPTNDTSESTLDVFGRTTSITDPLERLTTVNLDGEGRKLSQDDPRHGTTTYTRDNAGRLTKLTDPQGSKWDSTYTSMGRLTSFKDPNNRAQTRTYDNRGRLQTITNPDNIVETRSYNPDSTLQSRSYTGGLTHTFTYDALNRLSSANRTLGTKSDNFSLIYDSRNAITSTTVNGQNTTATYDTRNRLETITYPGGVTVTYTYDRRGLVTRIEDSLTNAAIDFTYNADREVTSATRSNGRATTYSYDGEGLLGNLTHDIGANIVWNYNRADEPTSIADVGFPTEALPNFVNGTETLAFDNSSQITTAGYTQDERGRRTTDPIRTNHIWDANDRLISITKDGTTITYCYDALGRLTSRTEGATTIDYLYNFALSTSPIIGERENGSLKRIYIAHPNGRIAYFIEDPQGTPAVQFYHFGKTGNTRFLTDASGNITDSYAYEPFGLSAGRTGSSEQIYTYVGAFGVRNDGTTCLLHMRNRYYDPLSRRFQSRDPIFRSLFTQSATETNPYHYARNFPTSAIDPNGLEPFATLVGGGNDQEIIRDQIIAKQIINSPLNKRINRLQDDIKEEKDLLNDFLDRPGREGREDPAIRDLRNEINALEDHLEQLVNQQNDRIENLQNAFDSANALQQALGLSLGSQSGSNFERQQ